MASNTCPASETFNHSQNSTGIANDLISTLSQFPGFNPSSAASAPLPSPRPCARSQAEKRKAETQGGSDEKRQKMPSKIFIQHPRFWFPDGNIQVQVGSFRFNLHRSRLITSSAWFKMYFEARDARELEGGVTTIDGSELVELDATGVHATDFQHLLVAMEDITDYYRSPPPFATLASILRAASILSFPKLRSYARDGIQTRFPDSLEAVGATIIPHAAEAIILARKWGLPGVLKRAFYELARSPLNATTASTLNLLAPADIALIAEAQKRLVAEWLTVYTPLQCEDCIESVTAKYSDISWFTSLPVRYHFDPILGLAALPQEYERQDRYCARSARARETEWKTHAAKIWETDLDMWFGLGGA